MLRNVIRLPILYLLILLVLPNNFILTFFSLWVVCIYTLFFEKKYNYTYILFISSFLFALLSGQMLVFLYVGLGTANQQLLVQVTTNSHLFLSQVINVSLYLDFFSANFILLTSFLTTVILLYSYNYMKGDVYVNTFSSMISFFAISMVTLLFAGNFFTVVLGWELIGLTSFLLINFWNNRAGTLKSALKAFVFNKISDSALFIFFIFLIYSSNTTLVFSSNFFFIENLENNLTYPYVFLLVAGFCKSVQFGFHAWLPDSMEAPIPASSLIHSATLVSAGIYLCYRFSPQIQMYFPYFVILSSFTAAYGAVIAACQTDLKKILAYSTISHCGYLFVLVFIGNTNLLLTYLHIHGVFKAFSFMLVGFILQNNSIYQDYRSIGYLFKKTSYEYYTLPFILFNLAGLPFFLGFFSKFLFLESFKLQWVGVLNILFVKLGAFCSILYSFQLYYNVFFAPNRSSNIPTTTNILTKNQNFIYKILSSFILIFITTITLFIFSLEFVGFAFSTQSVFFLKFFYKLLFLVFLVFFKNFNHTSLFIILVVVFYVLF